jgi:hypothetical protein
MTDQTRNQNQPNRSQDSVRDSDRSDTAEDRGLDRERRNVGGPREGDQFETAIDENRTADTHNTDEEEELGGFGRSER